MTDDVLIGARLRRLRKRYGVTQRAMNQMMCASSTGRWNNWEHGTRRLNIDVAIRLCDYFPGLDLDWIYRGKRDGLSADMLRFLYPKRREP